MAKSLKTLAAKPKLIKVIMEKVPVKEVVDGKEVVTMEDYEFYTWDRQPMEVFMALATSAQAGIQEEAMKIVVKLILDENGEMIVKDGLTLPTSAMAEAVVKLTELLGN